MRRTLRADAGETHSGFVGAVCDTEPGSAALPATWIVELRQGVGREGRWFC